MAHNAIGIDVGSKTLVTCIRDGEGTVLSPVTFPNTKGGIGKLIEYFTEHAIEADVPIVLESTGPYHWQAANVLTKEGYLAKVINPLFTKQVLKLSIRKRKTDKVDASHLAFLASQGYGYPFCETEEMVYKKALVRHYWKLRDVATEQAVHERYLRRYRGISKFAVSPPIVKQCEKLRVEIVKQFSKGNDVRYLDSIPGITPFLAANILAELTPLSRFQNTGQLVAFAGLDPQVKQSSDTTYYGKLSKRGSPALRKVLFLAAFGSFYREPFAPIYQQYKSRGIHHNAILCILSRKILRIAYTLLTKRETFSVEKLKV